MSKRFIYGLLAVLVLAGLLGAAVRSSQITAQQPASGSTPLPAAAVRPAPDTAAAGTLLLQERFDALPARWSQADQTLVPEDRGRWSVEAGALLSLPADGDPLGETMYLAPAQAAPATIAAQFFPQGNQTIGLVFNYSAAGYDLFRVFGDTLDVPHRAMLQHFDPQTGYTTLADVATGPGFVRGQWQELRIEQRDGRIDAYFKGVRVLSVETVAPAEGQAGVYTTAMGDVLIDNFVVARAAR